MKTNKESLREKACFMCPAALQAWFWSALTVFTWSRVWPCGDASRLLSCFTLVVALVLFASDSGINYNAWVKRSAQSRVKTLCSANNPDFCVRWRAGAHACLTVIKPLGLHLAFSQSLNALPLSFTISLSLCVIWVFPLCYYSCAFIPCEASLITRDSAPQQNRLKA